MERNQIEMPYRVLGRTGAGVSAIGLGGWYLALKTVSAELSTRIVHAAVDRGINFLDNSWDYNSNRQDIVDLRRDDEPPAVAGRGA